MPKRILTVGVDLASDDIANEDFDSRTSLLDWDIVLFRPSIESWVSNREQYKGKPSLNDRDSFQIKEASEHWRREIKQAVDSNKTVVVYLPQLSEVYIDTGDRQYSGTGRNRATTRIVSLFSNYNFLPLELQPVNSSGTAIKLASTATAVFAPYWSEFGALSEYNVLIQSQEYQSILLTRNGDRTVGIWVKSKTSNGSLLCLPDIDFYQDGFLQDPDDDSGTEWTPEAHKFAARLVASIVALDSALRAESEITPAPSWASDAEFTIAPEPMLRSKLLEVEGELERVQRHKEDVQRKLTDAGALRALLYEKGKPLEQAIISALTMIGFEAKPFRDEASEFDVVFESSEGRLIGEAEGKDNKAINVDKLRQLAMNLHEDLQREDVTSPAKGVLFGNPYRLTHPSERNEAPFTEKCVLAARSNGTALVTTSKLFEVAQYLSSTVDDEYGRRCRKILVESVGVVDLPSPPDKVPNFLADAEK